MSLSSSLQRVTFFALGVVSAFAIAYVMSDIMNYNQYSNSAPASKYNSSDSPNPIITLPDNNFTPEQLTCLAKNIYFEARNQSTQGQIAVALVTFNRVNAAHFPTDICKVVYQSKMVKGRRVGQFSWTSLKSHKLNDAKAWQESYDLATSIMTQVRAGSLHDFTNGALFYHADYVDPYWANDMTFIMTIGNHLFYKKPLKQVAAI